jgi:hypothetical protein
VAELTEVESSQQGYNTNDADESPGDNLAANKLDANEKA